MGEPEAVSAKHERRLRALALLGADRPPPERDEPIRGAAGVGAQA